MNISRIAVVLSQKFQEPEDTTDSNNHLIHGPRQDCVTCDNQQEPISAREFENIVIETDDIHQQHLWFLEGRVLEETAVI